jgi:hypothetical protein
VPGASDIKAGGAYYQLAAQDGLTPALHKAQAAVARFSQYMRSVPVIGGPLGAVGKALAPIGNLATAAGAAVHRAFAGALGAVDRLTKGAGRVGLALGAAGSASLAAFKPAFDAVKESGKVADLAEVFGLTGEKASRLFGIMGAAGSDLRDAQEGLATLNQRVNDAVSGKGEEAVTLFKELGVSAEQFANLDTADRLYKFVEAAKASNSPLGKLGLLMKGVGEDTGKNLSSLLTLTTDQMREMGDAFEQSGADLQASRETTRAYALAVAGLGRVWREVAAAIAPALTTLARIATQGLRPVVAWVKENKTLVAVALAVAGGLAAVGTALVGVGLAATVLGTAFGGLVTAGALALKVLGALAAVVFSPWTIAAAAVGGLTYAFLRYTDTGKAFVARVKEQAGALVEQLKPAFDKAREGFGAFANAIQKGDFAQAWEVVAAGATAAWTATLAKLGTAWDDFVRPIEDAIDDVFGGLGEVVEAAWAEVRGAFADMRAKIELVGAVARQVWADLKAGFRQAVEYMRGLWDRFGPAIMRAIEPVKPLLAALFAPVLLAVAAVRAAWDGLDKNISVTLNRLAKTIHTAWEWVAGTVENAFKRLAGAALDAVKEAAAALGAIPGGPDVSKILTALDAVRKRVGEPVDVEARVRAAAEKYDAVEGQIRERVEANKGERGRRNEQDAKAADERAAAALNRLDAAIAKANEPGAAPNPLLGGPLPNQPPPVPNVTVRGAFGGSARLEEFFGSNSEAARQTDLLRKLTDGEGGLPGAIARALAPLLRPVGMR